MSTPSPAPILRKELDLRVHGTSTDATNRSAWPALHLAAFAGDETRVRELLAGGVGVDQRSVHEGGCIGATALHCAAVIGAAPVVALLIRAGADLQARDEAGYTALHIAAERGDTAVVKLLVKGGAEVRAEIGDTSPLALARRGRHIAAAGLLKQVGAR